jgi:O-antigen/teichoic acid export membrane protein
MISDFFSSFKKVFLKTFGFIFSPRKSLKTLFNVSLYRNTFFLVLNNVILQATGFFFWMAAARFYSTEAVGLSSAANTSMLLLATLAALGLDFSLVRFLPNAGEKSKDIINTSFTIGGLVSVVLALGFIAGLNIWSPALIPIRQNPVFFIVFVVTVVATTLNTFAQRVFTAKLKSSLAMTRGLTFGLSRIVFLVPLAIFYQSFGIFTAWGLAVILAVVISLTALSKIENNYRPLPVVKKDILKDMMRFSFTNYIANIIWFLPGSILPIIVINMVGAEQNAYFYIAWALGNILFNIPTSLSYSLLAEASSDQSKMKRDVTRSLKLIMVILVLAILVMLAIGDKLLLLFGQAYSENATRLLQLLALSALPQGIIQVFFSVKRVEMRMKSVIVLSAFITIIALGLSFMLIPRIGIEGVGIARLVSQGVGMLIAIVLWIFAGKDKTPKNIVT